MIDGTRNRRLRALSVVETLGLTSQLEEGIVGCVSDDDYFVRMTAAGLLGGCESPQARSALREALMDPSKAVRDAAERSLQGMAHIPL